MSLYDNYIHQVILELIVYLVRIELSVKVFIIERCDKYSIVSMNEHLRC